MAKGILGRKLGMTQVFDPETGGVTAVYSGAPMPLSDANRRAGLAAVIDFDESGVRWRTHRVDPRPFEP